MNELAHPVMGTNLLVKFNSTYLSNGFIAIEIKELVSIADIFKNYRHSINFCEESVCTVCVIYLPQTALG